MDKEVTFCCGDDDKCAGGCNCQCHRLVHDIERHIAITSEHATENGRLRDLATELARYFTSGNDIPVERATVSRKSDLFLLLQEVLPEWDYHPFTRAADSASPTQDSGTERS